MILDWGMLVSDGLTQVGAMIWISRDLTMYT
jgi:hypothetical protein